MDEQIVRGQVEWIDTRSIVGKWSHWDGKFTYFNSLVSRWFWKRRWYVLHICVQICVFPVPHHSVSSKIVQSGMKWFMLDAKSKGSLEKGYIRLLKLDHYTTNIWHLLLFYFLIYDWQDDIQNISLFSRSLLWRHIKNQLQKYVLCNT